MHVLFGLVFGLAQPCLINLVNWEGGAELRRQYMTVGAGVVVGARLQSRR